MGSKEEKKMMMVSMKNTDYKATDIAKAIALAAVLGPAFIQPSVPSWIISSMVWQIAIGSTIIPLFEPFRLFLALPFTFMRLIVAFMFYRLYQCNKDTLLYINIHSHHNLQNYRRYHKIFHIYSFSTSTFLEASIGFSRDSFRTIPS